MWPRDALIAYPGGEPHLLPKVSCSSTPQTFPPFSASFSLKLDLNSIQFYLYSSFSQSDIVSRGIRQMQTTRHHINVPNTAKPALISYELADSRNNPSRSESQLPSFMDRLNTTSSVYNYDVGLCRCSNYHTTVQPR